MAKQVAAAAAMTDSTAGTDRIERALEMPVDYAGKRLDQAVALLLPEYSRTRIKEWIESGSLLLNGAEAKPRTLVLGGEKLLVRVQLAAVDTVQPQALALNIIHADKSLLVIDKPPGLVVHPGAGNRDSTLQNALLHYDPKLATVPRAGLVHRLDKDTSGLLVVARTVEAHAALVRQLQAREIERHYEAICTGVMTAGGSVDKPIGRHRTDRLRMTVREDGREALTHYRVIERFRAHTYVRVKLETGRTHQIRVHMAHIKYPIVGDRTYGGRLLPPRGATAELNDALRNFSRQALHAASLKLAHPKDGREMEWRSPLPADMRTLLEALARDAAQGGK